MYCSSGESLTYILKKKKGHIHFQYLAQEEKKMWKPKSGDQKSQSKRVRHPHHSCFFVFGAGQEGPTWSSFLFFCLWHWSGRSDMLIIIVFCLWRWSRGSDILIILVYYLWRWKKVCICPIQDVFFNELKFSCLFLLVVHFCHWLILFVCQQGLEAIPDEDCQ